MYFGAKHGEIELSVQFTSATNSKLIEELEEIIYVTGVTAGGLNLSVERTSQ